MFKITLEPNRLKTLLSQILALKSGGSSVDATLITFTPDGAKVKAKFGNDIMVFAKYNKEFFKTLEVDGSGEFMATVDLAKNRLAYGFSGEQIQLLTDKEHVYITGDAGDDRVKQKLDAINHDRDLPEELTVKKTVIGLIPEKDGTLMPFNFTLLVPVEKFTGALPHEHAVLNFDGKELTLHFSDEMGERDRPITYKDPRGELKAVSVLFNFKTFQSLIGQFTGEVWLSGDKKKLVVSQMNSDFSLTYAFATMTED